MLFSRQMILAGLAGVFLVANIVSGLPIFAYIAIVLGAIDAIPAAWETLRERRLDVETLMLVAAVGSILLGRPTEAAVLLFLFSLSKALEDLTMARTRNAIDALIRLRPSRATVVRDGKEIEVAVEEIQLDDTVLLPGFITAPVDGIVVAGAGAVDNSALTGESHPISVEPGSTILAGARNLEFGLSFRATSTVADSTLQKVVDLVTQAQENQGSGERASRWFGERYTWFVLSASIVMFLVKLAFHVHPRDAVYSSLTLLVALSPCALVISVPAAALSAMGWAARNGILVRGGEFIEKAGQVTAITFDKTGTLTSGKPQLVEICLCDEDPSTQCQEADVCWSGKGEMSDESKRILALAAAAESQSEHPVAHALRESADRNHVQTLVAEQVETVPGLGIRAVVSGKRIEIGQPKMFVSVMPGEFRRHVEIIQSNGWTVAVIAVDGKLAALGFEDSPRETAKFVLALLNKMGLKNLTMLTGDNERTASRVAGELGLPNYRAELMPGDKVTAIEEIAAEEKVMMVGDGINDAPALTKAYVGVAMGGLGSDIALNAADIVLMKDRLESVPEVIALGKRTNGIIKANLFIGGVVIATLTLTSLIGILPLPVAVVGHEGSTLVVILNGLRLLSGPKMRAA
ncbi:MAG: heavy metal translocating P-type ATPase [Armatimonadetes bacterium]|nr:heavy metal translocating P-type ATPase [Armatimonadota bacterium]